MYNIVLVNYVFDKNSNKSYFLKDRIERFNFFFNMENSFKKEDINFLIDNGINSRVQRLNMETLDLYKISKFNYALIYTSNDGVIDYKSARYYFVNNNAFKEGGTLYSFELELDDIMTNYFDNRDNIYGLVQKAHLNRFVKKGNIYTYNFNNENEHIYKMGSSFQNNDFIKQRHKLSCNDSVAMKWLSEHVLYWIMITISPGYVSIKGAQVKIRGLNTITGPTPYGVIFVPVTENNYRMMIREKDNHANNRLIRKDALDAFLNEDGNSAKIYNICIVKSIIPLIKDDEISYEIDKNIFYIDTENFSNNSDNIVSAYYPNTDITNSDLKFGFNTFAAFFYCSFNNGNYNYSSESLNNYIKDKIIFTKDYIKENSNNISPLLITKPFLKIRINDLINYFDYDVSLMIDDLIVNNDIDNISFRLTTGLDSGNEQGQLRLGKAYGKYNENYINYGGGMGYTNSISIPYTNSQYDTYIANNKNFRTQIIQNEILSFGNSIIGGLISPKSNPAVVAAKTISEGVARNTERFYQFDNMKSSPQALFGAQTSYYFNANKNAFGFYADIIEPLQLDVDSMLNNVKVLGYDVDELNYASKYDNIRKYYNHISIIVETIKGDLSQAEKDRLKEKLLNYTFVDINANVNALYENNNYERVLDDEET